MSTEPRRETLTRCLNCQEPIHPKAKLCKTCKSYQDWRRHFSFSAVVLSLLVALISVISAVGPRIISWLPPSGSRLEIKSFYYSTDAIVLIVENEGNQAGHIGRVNVVLYCTGAYFHQYQLARFLAQYQSNSNPSTQPPVWGVDIDLGTSANTSRTISARSSREISFILSRDMLRIAEEGFPKDGPYPAGDFRSVLYNESVRISIAVELWDYGQMNPKVVNITGPSGAPFWRGFTTITQHP
jgi:hypothetical protein